MDKQNKAYTYNGISSAIKWNTDPCYNIMLGEINRTWKINTVWLYLNEISIIGNSERQKLEERLPETGGGGNGELLPNGYKVSVCSDEKVLEIDSGNGCTRSWMSLILLIGTLLKWLKWSILCCIYFTTIKKVKKNYSEKRFIRSDR